MEVWSDYYKLNIINVIIAWNTVAFHILQYFLRCGWRLHSLRGLTSIQLFKYTWIIKSHVFCDICLVLCFNHMLHIHGSNQSALRLRSKSWQKAPRSIQHPCLALNEWHQCLCRLISSISPVHLCYLCYCECLQKWASGTGYNICLHFYTSWICIKVDFFIVIRLNGFTAVDCDCHICYLWTFFTCLCCKQISIIALLKMIQVVQTWLLSCILFH